MKKKSTRFYETVFQRMEPSQILLSSYNQKSYQKLFAGICGGKRLLILTGPAGCGKTILFERIFHELGAGVRLIKVLWDNLGTVNLIDYFGNELGVDLFNQTGLKEKVFCLTSALALHSMQHVIIQFDQAQRIPQQELNKLMKQIKSIGAAWDANHAPFLHTLIVGTPELELQIEAADLWKFAHHEVTQSRLKALSAEEIRNYILRHLERINVCCRTHFSDAALERIIVHSAGIPRHINKLCDLGLLTASMDEKVVSASLIDEVAQNCLIAHDAGDEAAYQSEKLPVSKFEAIENVIKTDRVKSDANSSCLHNVDAHLDSEGTPLTVHKIAAIIAVVALLSISAVKLGHIIAGRQTVTSQYLSLAQQDEQLEHKNNSQGKGLISNPAELNNSAVAHDNIADEQIWEIYQADIKETEIGNTNDFSKQKSELINALSDEQSLQLTEMDINEQQIGELLALAGQRLAKKQLMTPIEYSAWKTYNKVLVLSPGNQQALIGIEKIKTTYVLWANNEISKRNYRHARDLLSKALEISPNDPDILLLLSSIDLKNEKASAQKSKTGSFYRNRSYLSNDNRIFWYNLAGRRLHSNNLP